MIKKMGVVTVGVAAGLLAAAPFASATECHSDSHESYGSHESHSRSESNCNNNAGHSEANARNALLQAPIGGNNILNLNCSEILSNNLSGNSIDVL
jgi:hypothetical protein